MYVHVCLSEYKFAEISHCADDNIKYQFLLFKVIYTLFHSGFIRYNSTISTTFSAYLLFWIRVT